MTDRPRPRRPGRSRDGGRRTPAPWTPPPAPGDRDEAREALLDAARSLAALRVEVASLRMELALLDAACGVGDPEAVRSGLAVLSQIVENLDAAIRGLEQAGASLGLFEPDPEDA
jgi:hypothetical protein